MSYDQPDGRDRPYPNLDLVRRWDVNENEPDLVGKGGEMFVNGAEVRNVTAFDRDAGWVDAWCDDPECPEHPFPGKRMKHVRKSDLEAAHEADDPSLIRTACHRRFEGYVEIGAPWDLPY
jgi:hypothetical protein